MGRRFTSGMVARLEAMATTLPTLPPRESSPVPATEARPSHYCVPTATELGAEITGGPATGR